MMKNKYTQNILRKNGKKVQAKGVEKSESGGWRVSKEYLKYYESDTNIDYESVLMMRKKIFESRKGVKTAPEDKGPVDLSNINNNPIEALKTVALRFYSSIFPDEGPEATEFSKKILGKVKRIIYPDIYGHDAQCGELDIYTKSALDKNGNLAENGSNKAVTQSDGTQKTMVLLCLEADENGKPIPTFQKLYTLVHEISHSLGNDKGKNTRVANLFGETESMIIESLFSKFLLDNDDIQIPDKEKRVLNYEHGPSRVRTLGELLNIYKLGAQFYQRKQEEIQGKDIYINFEDEKTMNAVFMDLFGREARKDEIEEITSKLKAYKDTEDFGDPKHVLNNYFSHRYTIGNLIAPYIANTYFANPELGRQYIDNLWGTAYGRNLDGSEHTIEEVLESIGIEGEKGLEQLASEYKEWVTLANNGEKDKLFEGKTREMPDRKINSVIENVEDSITQKATISGINQETQYVKSKTRERSEIETGITRDEE